MAQEYKFDVLRRAIVALQDRPTAGNCGAAIQIANEIEREAEAQLKTVKYKNEETKSGMCSWVPPSNPFSRESTHVCRSLEIGCDVGIAEALNEVHKAEGRTLPVDQVRNPFRRTSTHVGEAVAAVRRPGEAYPERSTKCTCSHVDGTSIDVNCPVHGSARDRVQAITEQNRRAREAQLVCASTRGLECDCPGVICKVGSR